MPNYQKTKRACYLGFITQAIAANFAPLLFLKFHTDYHISLGNIAMISTCFFFTQLLIDLFCARFVDKIGYRVCIVTSEISSALGLVGLAFLPDLLPDPFIGIIISVIIYAVGSGLIEVLCSPIVEACPFENKEATMSLLHSFYCWGSVGTIAVSTLFFRSFRNEQLEMAGCIVGNRSSHQCLQFCYLSHRAFGRRRGRNEDWGAVSQAGVLDRCVSDGVFWRIRAVHVPVGFSLC